MFKFEPRRGGIKACSFKDFEQSNNSLHPWFTRKIDKQVEERDKRYRRYNRTRLRFGFFLFPNARDDSLGSIENAKLLYYNERLRCLYDTRTI